MASDSDAVSLLNDPSIIWLDEPLANIDIDLAAILFRDRNRPHMDAAFAISLFGGKANGRVAHANLVLGIAAGLCLRHYGDDTKIHELDRIKLSEPFCPGDKIGVRITEISHKERGGQCYIAAEIEIFRRRGDEVVAATPKKKVLCDLTHPVRSETKK